MKRLAAVAAYGITPGGRRALATLLDLLASDPNAPTTVADPTAGGRRPPRGLARRARSRRPSRRHGDRRPRRGRRVSRAGAGRRAARRPVRWSRARAQGGVHRARGRGRWARQRDGGPRRARRSGQTASARATSSPPARSPRCRSCCEYAAPLLRRRGVLVAWKGARDAEEERRRPRGRGAARPASRRGPRRSTPFAGAATRHSVVFRKVAPTPDRIPAPAGHGAQAPARAY